MKARKFFEYACVWLSACIIGGAVVWFASYCAEKPMPWRELIAAGFTVIPVGVLTYFAARLITSVFNHQPNNLNG